MPAKKAAKKAATRPSKPRKINTVSLRVDDDMKEWLDKRSGGEPYAAVIRQLIREAKERESKQR